VMSLGQIAEIATMATLGFFLKSLGWRTVMTVGVMGQVLRFAIYALGGYYGGTFWLWMIGLSNLVHGFAYAFFFATVYIFVDENFPKDVRTSAQGLFNLLILGLGPFLGNFLWGWLGDVFSRTVVVAGVPAKAIDFHQLFLVPLGFSLFAAALLAVFFHPAQKEPVPEATTDPALV
jgi:MFS family permease